VTQFIEWLQGQFDQDWWDRPGTGSRRRGASPE
jgi:hypothetical protein